LTCAKFRVPLEIVSAHLRPASALASLSVPETSLLAILRIAKASTKRLVPVLTVIALDWNALTATVMLVPVCFVFIQNYPTAILRAALATTIFIVEDIRSTVDWEALAFAGIHVEEESIITSFA
jgi:hypothetical protein